MFIESASVCQAVAEHLAADRYDVTSVQTANTFFTLIEQDKQQLDCLILPDDATLPQLANWMHGQAALLPAILLRLDMPATEMAPTQRPDPTNNPAAFAYHTAEVHASLADLDHLAQLVDQAISQFIHLSPSCRIIGTTVNDSSVDADIQDLTLQNFLLLQQRRLTEKLKERLGYLGVYYRRDPQNFFRNLPPQQKQELLHQLKVAYREIILQYFQDDGSLNQRIDELVNLAFFSDIAVSQIVETHMELMDDFAKQLKLEGRSEEILLDYRLTLIDTLAHLCEMYRRSVPRES